MNVIECCVIIVEDNPKTLFLTREILTIDLGIKNCIGRASGRQLFEYLATRIDRQRIDLILLDIQIPHEDGYQILEKIKNIPEMNATMIVAYTAGILEHNLQRVREAGFHGYIGKPIDPVRFPAQIIRLLNGEPVWEPQ